MSGQCWSCPHQQTTGLVRVNGGAGITAVALKQSGPWTYGALANHIVDIGADVDISATFLQPFVSYTTPTLWTYTVNTEATYDWEAEEWGVPINAMLSKLVMFGDQPVSIGGGVRYWADSAIKSGRCIWGTFLTSTNSRPPSNDDDQNGSLTKKSMVLSGDNSAPPGKATQLRTSVLVNPWQIMRTANVLGQLRVGLDAGDMCHTNDIGGIRRNIANPGTQLQQTILWGRAIALKV